MSAGVTQAARPTIEAFMNILLAFSPFLAFVVIERLLGILPGLLAGAALSIALLVLDRVRGGGPPKLLEVGTAVLFVALAAWSWLHGGNHWSIGQVRLRVDLGLLFIVLLSIAVRRPFTLQYARQGVPAEVASSPRFLRVNDVISAVWAGAFALMVVADLLLVYAPELPVQLAIIVTVVALLVAVKFTGWYPRKAA